MKIDVEPSLIRIVGDRLANVIYGTDNSDRILARGGGDRVEGAAGDDTIFGGRGDDFIQGDGLYPGILGAFYEYKGHDALFGGRGNDQIEGGWGDDLLNGGAGDDILFGDNYGYMAIVPFGDDTLLGGAGDDVIHSFTGADIIDGGSGFDTLNILIGSEYHWHDVETVDLDLENRKINYLSDGTQITGIERINITCGNGDDTIVGGRFADDIAGRGGADTITFGQGDTVSGGDGDDTFIVDRSGDCRAGFLTGDAGFDVLLLQTDEVERSMIFNGAGIGSLEKIEFVSEGRAVFFGGAPAISELEGSAGADMLVVKSAKAVDLSGIAVTGWDQLDRIKIVGLGQTNALTGSSVDDVIIGGAGSDSLSGGGGNDTLDGGSGADLLIFSAGDGSGGVDLVRHFSSDDQIGLRASGFAGLATGALDVNAFKDIGVAGSAVDADDRIIYDSRTGELFFDADGSGAGEGVLIAMINGAHVLSADDIVLL